MQLPLISDLLTEPLPSRSNLLVEYDSASQWNALFLAIGSGWLKAGGGVVWSVATQPVDNIRSQLKRVGLSAEELEREARLRLSDWYSATLGHKSREKYAVDSVRVADLSISLSKTLMKGITTAYEFSPLIPDFLLILDNISSLTRFNDEKNWVEFVLTRVIPFASAWKTTAILGLVRGIHSEWAHRQLETAVDGIVDLKVEETGKHSQDFLRIRTMRSVAFNREWQRLNVERNFKTMLEKMP